MIFGFETLSVVAAAAIVLALHVVWYSPQVFGRVWARSLGLDAAVLDMDLASIRQLVAMGILYFLGMICLANLMGLTNAVALSPFKIGAGLAGVFVLVGAIQNLQERRGLVSFAVSASFIAIAILVGTIIIGYWPW